MNVAYLLLLLIVIVITAIVLQSLASKQTEGFKDILTALPVLKTCPHKMKSFVDNVSNNTYCCDSAVNGNQCQGRKVCVMTPGATDSASCAQYLLDYTNKMSKKHCFDSMDKYYEDDSQVPTISGCAAQVNEGFSAPTPGSASCRIYPTQKDNQYKFDSCENKQMVSIGKKSSFCKTVNCMDVAIGGNELDVAWVSASYMSQDGSAPVQTWCEIKESVIRHIKYGLGDWFKNDAWAQPKTGDELTKALAQVNEGTYPGMCPTSYMVCNKKVSYFMIKGPNYIQVSQIVVKDMKGNNIARGAQTWSSEPWDPASKKEYTVDGTEAVREFPNIYHSKSGAADTYLYIQFPPSCVSEVILYGRNSYESQHANKTVMLITDRGAALWTARTNTDKIQRFTIPPNTFA